MAFEDRIVEHPNRYILTDADGNDSTVFLAPDPGEVTQEGTPLNAETLNEEIKMIAQEATGVESDSAGNAHFNNIQCGTAKLPTKANKGKVVSKEIAFQQAFSAAPVVVVCPDTSRPDATRATVGGVTATGFTIYAFRTTAHDTGVRWIAML